MERTVKITLRPKKPAASQMISKLYAEQTKLATQLYNKTIEAKRLQSELESEKRANADLEKIVSDQLSELNRARDMNEFLRLNNSGNVKEKERLSNELKITKLAMQDIEDRLSAIRKEISVWGEKIEAKDAQLKVLQNLLNMREKLLEEISNSINRAL